MKWTKPGLDLRGELRERTYVLLIQGFEINWKTGLIEPACRTP